MFQTTEKIAKAPSYSHSPGFDTLILAPTPSKMHMPTAEVPLRGPERWVSAFCVTKLRLQTFRTFLDASTISH